MFNADPSKNYPNSTHQSTTNILAITPDWGIGSTLEHLEEHKRNFKSAVNNGCFGFVAHGILDRPMIHLDTLLYMLNYCYSDTPDKTSDSTSAKAPDQSPPKIFGTTFVISLIKSNEIELCAHFLNRVEDSVHELMTHDLNPRVTVGRQSYTLQEYISDCLARTVRYEKGTAVTEKNALDLLLEKARKCTQKPSTYQDLFELLVKFEVEPSYYAFIGSHLMKDRTYCFDMHLKLDPTLPLYSYIRTQFLINFCDLIGAAQDLQITNTTPTPRSDGDFSPFPLWEDDDVSPTRQFSSPLNPSKYSGSPQNPSSWSPPKPMA